MAGLPLLMVDNNSFYSLSQNTLVSLGGGEGIGDGEAIGGGSIVGSSHGWLVLFNWKNLNFFMWNPLSNRRIHLPPVRDLHIHPNCNHSVAKVILSSCPDDADCRAVMIYGSCNRLAFCCPGWSAGWILIGNWFVQVDGRAIPRVYRDIAYSSTQNRLFCFTEYKELERWDLRDPWSPRIDGSNGWDIDNEVGVGFGTETATATEECYNLVVAEQSNQVYVLVRNIWSGSWSESESEDEEDEEVNIGSEDYPYKTVDFDVYRVVEEGEGGILSVTRVEEEESLDGVAMFVGMNHSFTLSAVEFPELKPDSIYFTHSDAYLPDKTIWWNSSYGKGHYDIGIFNYPNRSFYPCYSPPQPQPDDQKVERRADLPLLVWFTPTSQ